MTRGEDLVQFLHSLGYIYANHGQSKRALVFQLLASRLEPENKPVLRTLAHTFLNDEAPEKALAVLERLRALGDNDPLLDLLEGQALWQAGDKVGARRVFRNFLRRRRLESHA